MSDTVLFLLTILPASFLLGLNDVLVRKILRRDHMNEQTLVAYEYVATAVVLGAILLVTGVPAFQPGFWSAIAVTVPLNIFAVWAWYEAFRREEASFVSPLRLLSPPITILTGFFVLGESPSAGGVIGILLTVCGLWALLYGEANAHRIRLRGVLTRPGVLFGLYGAISFAFSLPFDKKVVGASSALTAVTLIFLGVGVGNIVIALLRRNRRTLTLFTRENRGTLAALPLVHALASFLSFAALNYALVSYVSSVKRLLSLWAVILSGAFLKEGNIRRKLAATGIMLAGVAVTVFFG